MTSIETLIDQPSEKHHLQIRTPGNFDSRLAIESKQAMVNEEDDFKYVFNRPERSNAYRLEMAKVRYSCKTYQYCPDQ